MSTSVFVPDELRTADVLVVGGGVAGLTAALHAKGSRVVLVGKTAFSKGGSSVHAQGGVAAALGDNDSPSRHAEDTITAGAGLCDPEVVRRVTEDGPRRIGELITIGAQFDRENDGCLSLGREAAHSRHRVAHAAGDATGHELVRALANAVQAAAWVEVESDLLVLDLVMDHGSVAGAMAVDCDGRRILYITSEVVLATGGIGHLWLHTTNPPEVSGDGLAMAIRAGARVADLEFVQFHPTALAVEVSPMPLLTEALRGEGARLVDGSSARFMLEEHPDGELAPRDVVARAIWRRLRDGERIFLDATAFADKLENRFPTVVQLCRDHGFELEREPVPVSPAAHYHMGGVMTDAEGRTSIPGLWACGEVARTGLHGANRLASNSLLEALVSGATIGETLAAGCRAPQHPLQVREVLNRNQVNVSGNPWGGTANGCPGFDEQLRKLMWLFVGLERDAAGLERASAGTRDLGLAIEGGVGEEANRLLVAKMVVQAATARTESRGAHRRADFPSSCASWSQPLIFEGERMVQPHPVTTVAVSG